MQMRIPDFGLVVLMGASGAGKTTFARKHFRESEVLSSDHYRTVVGDDDRGGQTTKDAFDIITEIAARRLRARRVAVIDATNVQPEDRKRYTHLARSEHAPLTAILLDLPEGVCLAHNAGRGKDARPQHVVRRQARGMRRHVKTLSREGYRHRLRLRSAREAEAAELVREPLATDHRTRKGPFDIIGDVHGCARELEALLRKLGYEIERSEEDGAPRYQVKPPAGRTAVFVGDLVDRGPKNADALALAMDAAAAGHALVVPGNHDAKLARALGGAKVETKHGLAETLAELETRPEEFRKRVQVFLAGLPSHYVLDDGRLVVAHAGMKTELQNRTSREVREFGLYGETTGETDEDGLPVRADWGREYRGTAVVAYGHTPVREAEWTNNTICIDTGCAFGGRLTALRWPERETVSVAAEKTYHEPTRALAPREETESLQQQSDAVLSMDDVRTPMRLETSIAGSVGIRKENGAAALEILTRFGVDPRWMIYLPPTMAPCAPSTADGLLEHPAEAFGYFRARGIRKVMCQEKHMGSRAVIVCGRSRDEAKARFGADSTNGGKIYTRTGRTFFNDEKIEGEVLDHVRAGMSEARLWDELATNWVCLDTEIMPWSAKGAGLIHDHYEPVAAAAVMALTLATETLRKAAVVNSELVELANRFEERSEMARLYDVAYQRYSWPVNGTDGLKVAPFHLLATEGAEHTSKSHEWHMEMLGRLCEAGGTLTPTEHRTVDVDNEDEVAATTAWWTERTEAGAEGMVVKPMEFIKRTPRETIQPALKCRGREYLRIIYGPEYTTAEQLTELRRRNSGGKMRLALREFALGIEALREFVNRNPLRRVHRAVFGVLALETEPTDPRL